MPGLVAAVDKLHEIRGRAKAAGGGEVAERLVAPGAVERMLHDGQQFDVGVAEILHVGNELIGEFAIAEPAIVVFGNAAPGAEMDFVNGDRRFEPILLWHAAPSTRHRSTGCLSSRATTEPVLGRNSAEKAYGSALSGRTRHADR